MTEEKPKSKRPPAREGKKVVTAYLDHDQVKRLRVLSAEAGLSMELLIGELIDAEWIRYEARRKDEFGGNEK